MPDEMFLYILAALATFFALGILGLQVHWLVLKVNKIEKVVKELNPGADL